MRHALYGEILYLLIGGPSGAVCAESTILGTSCATLRSNCYISGFLGLVDDAHVNLKPEDFLLLSMPQKVTRLDQQLRLY